MYILLENRTNAIPIQEYKDYGSEKGYVALLTHDHTYILCKYLSEIQIEMFGTCHLLCDCRKEPLTNESVNRIGKPVMIITKDATSFSEIDKAIENACGGTP